MNRCDELTAKLLDGTLTEPEWAELELLLAADPAAADGHLALLELEAVLRGERADFDLTEQTLEKVKDAQAEKTTHAVMAEIATRPAPQWAAHSESAPAAAPRSRRWVYGVAGLFAVAAGLVVGLWLGTESPKPPENTPLRPDASFARLTHTLGSVELLTPQGEVLPAGEGREVPPGHTLRTVGEDSLA